MRCVFINLPAATQRRALVERSFARVPHAGWTLERFSAVEAQDAVRLPGRLRPAHKGCFESHRRVVESALGDADPIFIAEDDVEFSSQTFAVVDQMLGRGHDWDILLTDVILADVGFMAQLGAHREAMVRERRFVATNLRGRMFSGATAYVVRGGSKAKLHGLLSNAPLDEPYDLHLRSLANADELKVAGCFPFVTSISDAAENSQIGDEALPLTYEAVTAFRRMMYVERDMERCRAADGAIRARSSETALLVGTLLGVLADVS